MPEPAEHGPAVLGLFVPGDGWLHRLHPYSKLVLLVAASVAPFVLPVGLLPAALVANLAAGLTAGLGAPFLRRALLAPLPVVIPIVLINALFLPGASDVLVPLGPLTITREGLEFGLPIAGRFLAAAIAIAAFATATRPDDLMTALVARGLSPRLAFVVLSALQAIPRLADRATRIQDAQRSRGVAAEGSIGARLRALRPLAGPLVIGTLIDVRDRSLALEARAFSASGPRSAYRQLPWRPLDIIVARVAWLMLGLLLAVAIGRIGGLLP